ncbi:hypothetical protein AB1Y20_007661 [Prymnesium parvum]|uniref:Uncharacterized protein n=1 Tax=Prymnesium parvum TaxID=97485 RepID=A0AB34IW43_PRYPA
MHPREEREIERRMREGGGGGKRTDLYLPALNVALDVKTGSLKVTLFTSKTPAHVASHTPVAATAEVFLLRAFGDPRRGSSARHSLCERLCVSSALVLLRTPSERHPTAVGPSADRSFYTSTPCIPPSSPRRDGVSSRSRPSAPHQAPRAGGRSFC